jgi:UDP-2,3-diacylglucosamine hydrolase
VVEFLRKEASLAKSLFLLGDIFDFWFEWRHSVPSAAFPVLSALHELALGGCRILYLGGNHDGHVGRFLTEQVGIEVSRGPVDITIDDKRFHLIHGDGLAPSDHGYRALRRLVRWTPTEALYRLVHPDFGVWFANKVSGVSREQFSSKVVWAPESYRNYAKGKIEEGFDCVVMGHRHEAERIEYGNGVFLAVGDWIRSGSYGVFEEGKIELRFFR